jgi:hypothetical protein
MEVSATPLRFHLEQFYPQFAFQVVNLLAERRLRNVRPTGGVSEIQFLCGGGDEVFKMAELHGWF